MIPPNLPVKIDPSLLEQLTPREAAFIMHPNVMTDPRQAARAAGYAETTAEQKSYEMRKQLMYYILPLYEARLAQIPNVNVERIKDELAPIAFANLTDYYDTVDIGENGQGDTIKVLKDIKRMPDHMQRAIKKVEFETIVSPKGDVLQRLVKLELYDKLDALKELAEIFGLKDPRTRKPVEVDDPDEQLLSQLEPEEIESMAQTYEKARNRLKAKASKKRDAQAIPGKRIEK